MARKDNRTGSPQDRHHSGDDRTRRHLEPRAGDVGRASWVHREPPMYFYSAFSHEDEIPPDLPRD